MKNINAILQKGIPVGIDADFSNNNLKVHEEVNFLFIKAVNKSFTAFNKALFEALESIA